MIPAKSRQEIVTPRLNSLEYLVCVLNLVLDALKSGFLSNE